MTKFWIMKYPATSKYLPTVPQFLPILRTPHTVIPDIESQRQRPRSSTQLSANHFLPYKAVRSNCRAYRNPLITRAKSYNSRLMGEIGTSTAMAECAKAVRLPACKEYRFNEAVAGDSTIHMRLLPVALIGQVRMLFSYAMLRSGDLRTY